jgi:glycosyltransferase involved in cell wall biosynthesis
MIDLYSSHEFYLSTSKSDGSSVSLIEALSVGCIPIVSDFPTNLEWVWHGKNGLVFKNGSKSSLIKTLNNALEMSDAEKFEIRRHAIKSIEKSGSWEINSQRLINFLVDQI